MDTLQGIDAAEIWKPVVGFEALYLVSSYGRVWSVKRPRASTSGRILRPCVDKKGYARVVLSGKTKKVHRLVLEAFVGPCPTAFECAHDDGNAANNRLPNLAWKTCKQNADDRLRHGTYIWGALSPDAKLTDEDVVEIRRARKRGEQWKDIHLRWPHVGRTSVLRAGNGISFRYLSEPPASQRRSRVASKK